ncbi:MAG: DEAD/DEAH box helicase [Rhodothermales bacterium]|nr:DEAD/DEAH box helicase [Rhodothermales bacterium]MBO6778784.1 DEAD/DEAH box helicase [Rhodothermales bacterium]
MSRFTKTIDLTSRAREQAKVEQQTSEFLEPDPPLPAASVEGLPEALQEAVRSAGWTSLMPVQQKAIPYLLDGRDMIVQSKTGSGKTGGFLLPLFRMLEADLKQPQALVLSPTRELARQIYDAFMQMRGDQPLTAVSIYGGVRYGPQLDALEEGRHVVVGTPGRVLDHIQRGTLKLDNIRMFVLDEADEMLSMGFLPDMREMRRYLPKKRQSCMFSATMPYRVRALARDFLDDPGFLSLSTGSVGVDAIQHTYYRVDPMQKDRTLQRLIELENPESAIIFANTKREVEYLGTFLANYGYDAASISGDLSQKARERIMARIRKGNLRLLVATDVAARGIDISDLSHVFMYDVPQDQEYYIHRAGRTARAGKTGSAIVLATIDTEANLKRTCHKYGIEVERKEVPTDEDVQARVSERMTVLLESRYRDKTNMNRERLGRFVPMVEELAQEEPELLAMLIDDLYHENLHGAEEEADHEAEREKAQPKGGGGGRGRGRGRGRRR